MERDAQQSNITTIAINLYCVDRIYRTESSNELGIKDETNEKGSADVIISVSTGALVNYVATTIITLVVLAGLAYLVNKKYLSKKI